MPHLEEQELKNETLTDWDEIGEQAGEARSALPPGDYEFQLPPSLTDAWTTPFDTTRGKRVSLMVDLVITNAKNKDLIGETRRFRISGAERNRAKKGAPERIVSDLQFFYRDALRGTTKPKTFADLCKSVEKEGAGRKFIASVEWSSYCDRGRVRYIQTDDGQSIEDPEKKMGCGKNYYQNSSRPDSAIPHVDGQLAERFGCGCGAVLRAFDGLTRFRVAQVG